MSCIENLHKAYILTWIGDYETASKLAKECLQLLSDSKQIRKKIREIVINTDRNYEIAKKLREEGITTTDLIQLALYNLARKFSIRRENIVEIIERNNIKVSIIKNSLTNELRGYCEGCKGYKYSLLKKGNGYFIVYNEIIYAEFSEGDINEIIEEIIKSIKF
jgi:hypothetical protein